MPAIDVLFQEMIRRGATDLHLAVHQPPLARIRGDLVVLADATLTAKELEEMLLELVSPAQRARLASELDLDLAYAYKDVGRFRGTIFVKHSGIAAVFRLVPSRIPTLAELGCPEAVVRLAQQRSGLLVVTGPASNGKSTTTASIIDHVNRTRPCHVVTIENPIEFVHEPVRAQVTQREVGAHVPSFAIGIRNAARENADVVFVSETPGREEVELVLRLAGEGMAVIMNATTSGVVSALDRLVGVFDESAQPRVRARLAACLSGVIAQHLVLAADNTRLSVFEILLQTPATAAAIRDGRMGSLVDVMRSGESAGMQLLDAALERHLANRRITPETAFERWIDKAVFAEVVSRARPDLVDPPSPA